MLWKVPGNGDLRLGIYVRLPEGTTNVTEPTWVLVDNAYVERWTVRRAGGLTGETIRIDGLSAIAVDVLVRVERLDGTTQVERLTPASPSFVMLAKPDRVQVARNYLALGVEHILTGFDHLLFLLGLLLLVRGLVPLLKTITAFTVAHSITLTLAALGVVHVPPPPVEATIALSIVFVGAELVKQQRGIVSLAQQYPWVVAGAFGFLHGLGFAGALARMGLPQGDIPLALFMFNVGVEIGQLMFVAAFLVLARAVRRVEIRWPSWTRLVPGYAIGSIAAFWMIQRVVGGW